MSFSCSGADFYGILWIFMLRGGFLWIFMLRVDFCGILWMFIVWGGFRWIFMIRGGFLSNSIDFHASGWSSMEFYEFLYIPPFANALLWLAMLPPVD